MASPGTDEAARREVLRRRIGSRFRASGFEEETLWIQPALTMTKKMAGKSKEPPMFDRELSWLAFNERVLQEARDPGVPVRERLDFLAIFSSNLDEFFRVRVASLRSLLRLKKKSRKGLSFNPVRLLQQIHTTVNRHQEEFGRILRDEVLPELRRGGLVLLDNEEIDPEQRAFLESYFRERVAPALRPIRIGSDRDEAPFLENNAIYLVVELWPPHDPTFAAVEPSYGLLHIPSPPLPRFVDVPNDRGRREVVFLDDVIRLHLDSVYPDSEPGSAFSVKLTRDADLQIEDEYGGDLVEMIRKALTKRDLGPPSRFLYDKQAPYALVAKLKEYFNLENEDIVVGGKYHNLSDLMSFPRPDGGSLVYPAWPPVFVPDLNGDRDVFDVVRERDRAIHFPYHSYSAVLRFLREAADDPAVSEIWITLYRVARDSEVAASLMQAARNGKRVSAFVEVKARFDEAPNLDWARQMEDAGVHVSYSLPGLKVHAKIALVARQEEGGRRLYAFLSTGNFNEKTARIYADTGLFTANDRLTRDVEQLLVGLTQTGEFPKGSACLIAPRSMRKRFVKLVDFEIEEAKAGRTASMMLKMNSIEDADMIERLYEASSAGVEVRLIIRGICRLVPGSPGLSENIEVVSLVDRFLEHTRVYRFHHGGEEHVYLASADWMTRNLSRRIELAFPLFDEDVRRQVATMLRLQWADNVKVRTIDRLQTNLYRPQGAPALRAQEAFYRYVSSGFGTNDGST